MKCISRFADKIASLIIIYITTLVALNNRRLMEINLNECRKTFVPIYSCICFIFIILRSAAVENFSSNYGIAISLFLRPVGAIAGYRILLLKSVRKSGIGSDRI